MGVVATAECPQTKATLQQFHRHIQGKHTSNFTSLTILTAFTVAVKEESAYLEISNHPIRYKAHRMLAQEAPGCSNSPQTNSVQQTASIGALQP
jgi:hypothetical protein